MRPPLPTLSTERPLSSTAPGVRRFEVEDPQLSGQLLIGDGALADRARAMIWGGPFTPMRIERGPERSYVHLPERLLFTLADTEALPPPAAFAVALRLAEALDRAHDNQVVHGHLNADSIGFDAVGRLRIVPALHHPITQAQDAVPTAADDCLALGRILAQILGWSPPDWSALPVDGVDARSARTILRGLLRERVRLRLSPARAVRQTLSSLFVRSKIADPDAPLRAWLKEQGLPQAQLDSPSKVVLPLTELGERAPSRRLPELASGEEGEGGLLAQVQRDPEPEALPSMPTPLSYTTDEVTEDPLSMEDTGDAFSSLEESEISVILPRGEPAMVRIGPPSESEEVPVLELGEAGIESEDGASMALAEWEEAPASEAEEEAERVEAERVEAERLEAEAEAERLEAEAEAERLEAERLEAERLENERIAAEEEAARIEAERLEAEEAARIEAARIEAARIEAERLEAEEAARIEAERLEAARIEAERLEAERLAAEEESARIEAERLEAEEAARIEAERLAAEEAARVRAAQSEAERIEADRLAAERAEEAERQREAARIEAERLEAERLEAERIEAERLEAERLEAARVEAERLEAERLEAERLEAARVEAGRVEAARIEAARIEAERVEAERIEAERVEAERIEAERVEAERLEAARIEAERLAAEQAARAGVEAETSLEDLFNTPEHDEENPQADSGLLAGLANTPDPRRTELFDADRKRSEPWSAAEAELPDPLRAPPMAPQADPADAVAAWRAEGQEDPDTEDSATQDSETVESADNEPSFTSLVSDLEEALAKPKPSGPAPILKPQASVEKALQDAQSVEEPASDTSEIPPPPESIFERQRGQSPGWGDADLGVGRNAQREEELGDGKWTESGRSAKELADQLPSSPVRELEIEGEDSGGRALLIGLVTAVLLLGGLLWVLMGPKGAEPITIQTHPAGLRVSVDGQDLGKAPADFELPSGQGEHRVCAYVGEDQRCKSQSRAQLRASKPAMVDFSKE